MATDPATLQAAVDKIMPTGIRWQYDSLGTRKVGTSFGDFRDAVLGTFVSSTAAPYYVVKLGRGRVVELSTSVRSSIAELSKACLACTRTVQPVTNLAPLHNARTALAALAKSTGERTGVYQSIATVPSFRRFEQNVNTFLSTEGVKSTHLGELTDTPTQAQASLRKLSVSLRSAWEELVKKVTIWSTSIQGYAAMNLPAGLSQTVLQNTSDLLDSITYAMEAASPTDRLKLLRESVVNLSAAKATVRGFGSIEPPTTYLLLDGTGNLYSDIAHPTTPAVLPSGYLGGYKVYPGNDTLSLLLDGVHTLSINPPGSYVARIDGASRGPYTIDVAGNSMSFAISNNDSTSLNELYNSVVLTPGTREPWEVVAELNAQAPAILAGLYFVAPKTTQEVDYTAINPTSGSFKLVALTTWGTFGVVAPDKLLVNDSVWVVTSVSGDTLYCSLVSGPSMPSTPGLVATVGKDADIRYYVQVRNTLSALEYKLTLATQDIEAGTCAAIGLYSGAKVESTRTSAKKFVEWVNQTTAAATLDGVPRVSATELEVPVVSGYKGMSHPEDAYLVSFFSVRTEATITNNGVSDTTFDSADMAAEGVGASVVVRGTNSPSDTGAWGTITNVSGTLVTIDVHLVGTGSALVDVGGSYFSQSDLRRELAVKVEGAGVSDGLFPVSSDPPPSPLDIRLAKPLTGHIGLGGQPVSLPTVSLVGYKVVLSSRDETLSSSVSVTGSGSFDSDFSVFLPATAVASTRWVRLPSLPRQLELGDELEVYLSDPITPDIRSAIQYIDAPNKLVSLVDPQTGLPSFSFTVGAALPFARIRKTVKQNYDEVSSNVSKWLEKYASNNLQLFRELDAGINPLVANTTPSLQQSNPARMLLQSMYDSLVELETYLAAYDARVVEPVDTIIRGYTQKGVDRAIDILISGDFPTFFGLELEDATYLGSLQKAVRAVERDDFPVRRDNRNNAGEEYDAASLGSFDDVDFEYNPEQLDPDQRIAATEFSSPTFDG